MSSDNPFSNAMQQLEKAAQILNLSSNLKQRLSRPDHVHEAELSITMDDGSEKKFTAYRSQFNNILGPYKGGIRFHPNVSKDEVMALSFWMTIKTAAVGLPLGGGKGGVIVDPRTLSQAELERLSRAYVQVFHEYLGPDQDVPAPDVYTNSQIMDWMADEYGKITGSYQPGIITGKSITKGGSLGRDTATADGGFVVLTSLLQKLGNNSKETSVIVQGFGNAGANFARLAYEHDYKLLGVSDSREAVYDPTGKGYNYTLIEDIKKGPRGIVGVCEDYDSPSCTIAHKRMNNEDFLTQETDVLVLAALENQITKDNADKIKAKIIIELANGPITPEADEILKQREIIVVPDVLANAGGVTVSYFEWLQNTTNEQWTAQRVREKLQPIMEDAFEHIWNYSKQHSLDLRTAAFVKAIDTIAQKAN